MIFPQFPHSFPMKKTSISEGFIGALKGYPWAPWGPPWAPLGPPGRSKAPGQALQRLALGGHEPRGRRHVGLQAQRTPTAVQVLQRLHRGVEGHLVPEDAGQR